MILVDCEQNSDEWRLARLGLATASSFAVILSKGTRNEEAAGRRNLRSRLVLERLTGAVRQTFDSFATRQGHEREPAARFAYEVETGDIVTQPGFCRHDRLEAGASPDGFIGTDGGLEIKSPQPDAHLEVLRRKRVPSEYWAQVQGGMWICQRKWWRFVSFNPDFPERHRLRIIHVDRDQRYIDTLATEVEVFLDEVKVQLAEVEAL